MSESLVSKDCVGCRWRCMQRIFKGLVSPHNESAFFLNYLVTKKLQLFMVLQDVSKVKKP